MKVTIQDCRDVLSRPITLASDTRNGDVRLVYIPWAENTQHASLEIYRDGNFVTGIIGIGTDNEVQEVIDQFHLYAGWDGK